MYDNKTVLIIDYILAGIFTVLAFAKGITRWGEPYNELYFCTSFICGILTKFIAEKTNKKAKKAGDLKVKDATLIKIRKGKNVEYTEGSSQVIAGKLMK